MSELDRTYWSLLCAIVEGDDSAIPALKDFCEENGYAGDSGLIGIYVSFRNHHLAPKWLRNCRVWIDTGKWPLDSEFFK